MQPSSKIRDRILGFVVGVFVVLVGIPAGAYLYMRYGEPPVAVADKPFPDERQIVDIALDARINRQLSTAPLSDSPEDLTAGAHIYVTQCAACHGQPGRDSELAKAIYPTPPQVWVKNSDGSVGQSNDSSARIYWAVDNGIRLTAMPSFDHILTERQRWQVSLLLKHAGQPLPPATMAVLQEFRSGSYPGEPILETPSGSGAK